MAAGHSFESVHRAVRRGELRPVYYLTGDEDMLKDELVRHIVERAVDPAARDFNVDAGSAGDLDAERFHVLVDTPPMLAARRVVVIRHLEQWRRNAQVWRAVDRYVADPAPGTVLVLVHGAGEPPRAALASAALHVVVDRLDPARLARWVERRVEGVGVVLDPDAAEHLIRAVGADLAALAMEIDKLAVAAPDGPVTVQEVGELVGVRRGETAADFVAAVLMGDASRALAMLTPVLSTSGASGVRLVAAVGTGLVGVRLAAALASRGLRGGRLERALFEAIRKARPAGLRGWRDEAAAWARAAAHWSPATLAAATRAAADADRALKSTTIRDEHGILATMVLTMGARRAAA